MSEDQTMCSCDYHVCCDLVDWITGCDDYLYPESLTSELPSRKKYTSCAHQRETRGIELSGS